METSASKSELFLSSLYHIYGDEENIYESIKKKERPLAETYDEVFQSKPSRKEFEPQQLCDTSSEQGLPSTYGEFRETTCTNLVRKCFETIPLWVKISIPIIIMCVTVGFNGMLIAELKLCTQINKSSKHNTSTSSSSFYTTTTAKTYSAAITKEATTVVDDVSTTIRTWNYANKSWYIESDIPQTYICDTWKLISTVKFQPLDLCGTICYSIPNCLQLIDSYKFSSHEKANYTFYIDQYGNIYEGRDWYCSYMSGELWIALLVDDFNILKPKSELQLRHFYEMVSYKRAFEYFDEGVEEEFVDKCSLASHMSSICV